jgi:hypothetical protein
VRPRVVTRGARYPYVVGMGIAIAGGACSADTRGENADRISSAIIDGIEVDSPNSPVLLLSAPGLLCTAILIGPKLVATARHCVASLTEGDVTCTPSGDLAPNSAGGALGADFAPSSLAFFLTPHAASGVGGGMPDALGAQTLSTGSPSSCRDDIAFVVLDRVMAGIVPSSVRLSAPTSDGEFVSLSGYGLTDEAGAQTALRVHSGAQVVAVGPSMPVDLQQPAPVRAVRIGPGSWACNGDSGGPISSQTTGALIAIVSFGEQASASGPYCTYSPESNTTGPRLAEYQTLAMQAFAAAGDAPIPEPVVDASASDDPSGDGDPPDPDAEAGVEDGGPEAANGDADPGMTPDAQRAGSCAAAPAGNPEGGAGLALAMSALATGLARRRRAARAAVAGCTVASHATSRCVARHSGRVVDSHVHVFRRFRTAGIRNTHIQSFVFRRFCRFFACGEASTTDGTLAAKCLPERRRT